ncbi:MAG: di-heme oxidoredictase family protein, partial [Gemmatimonadota bacterium]
MLRNMHPGVVCSFQRAVLVAALALAGCDTLATAGPPDDEALAGPIPGLSGPQLARHFAGDAEFGRVFSAGEGLGPIFVAASCESCHAGDGKGHPAFNLRRFGRTTANGFDPMRSAGGPQIQNRAILRYITESVPGSATGMAVFTAPAVTGLGYLEAVDDQALLDIEDPNDLDGDGISGRVQLVDASDVVTEITRIEDVLDGNAAPRIRVDGRYLGRFGKKASAISLLHQTVSAYREDMGITSDILPDDPVNRQVGGLAADDVPDPEVPSSSVQSVVFYLRTLKVPPRRNLSDPQVAEGEQLFRDIGCTKCHLASLTTGPSSLAALDRVTFHPYTDLLLHDMGPELDD